MSTQNDELVLDVQQIREHIEDYQTTIHAILCFVSAVTWDDAAHCPLENSVYSIGRRMDTSQNNLVSPSQSITPDIVIQRTPDLGYVVEAKKSLPRNDDHWEDVVTQIVKYDDDLLGWWNDNANINSHCTVLLLEISRTADFKDYLASRLESGEIKFVRPFSLIEFTRSPEARQYLFVRKLFGEIENEDVSKKLHSGTKVPIEHVLATFGEKKFYDTPPPVEHTMVILWQHIFTDLRTSVDYDAESKAWPLLVDIGSLTTELQHLYGDPGNEPREVSFPRSVWIKDALDGFVRINLARRAPNDGHYTILFKRLRGDILDRFSKNRPKSKKPIAEDSAQLLLI